ncbi:MAG TPA: diguanylate cyclase [Solirubrobacteraceae bacterium]|jgi:diguanylate cyclase (GGDEF)-like protein|nr:diguanylate cyclase [Solirubrobacteraceae bacterium]
MAAKDSQHSTRAQAAPRECLSATELAVRLEEEVNRASRHRTQLSCLLVSLDGAEDLSHAYGQELPAQALAYLGAALIRQLRRFDRVGQPAEGELLVVLPGADERRAEIVARRALGRLHSVKIEVEGKREPLRISVGIAAWREGLEAGHLLSHTRAAAQRGNASEHHSEEPLQQSVADVAEMPSSRRS